MLVFQKKICMDDLLFNKFFARTEWTNVLKKNALR